MSATTKNTTTRKPSSKPKAADKLTVKGNAFTLAWNDKNGTEAVKGARVLSPIKGTISYRFTKEVKGKRIPMVGVAPSAGAIEIGGRSVKNVAYPSAEVTIAKTAAKATTKPKAAKPAKPKKAAKPKVPQSKEVNAEQDKRENGAPDLNDALESAKLEMSVVQRAQAAVDATEAEVAA